VTTLYDILEIPSHASQEDIEAAVRRELDTYPPEYVNTLSDPEREQVENHLAWVRYAGEVLSNPETRRNYDDEMHAPPTVSKPPVWAGGAQSAGPVEAETESPAWKLAYRVALGVAAVGAAMLLWAKGCQPPSP
jgi:DnaJ-class molecular chaperone